MAASTTGVKPVYCDLSRGVFIAGRKDRTETQYPFGPKVFHKNTLNLQIFPLEVNPAAVTGGDPFTMVSTSGLSLVLSIYSSDGSTLLATASSFTEETGTGTLIGQLDLNTTEMGTAITSLEGSEVIIEARFVNPSGETNVSTTRKSGSQSKILKQLNATGAPTPVPGETYVTLNELKALAVLKAGQPGETKTWISADGSKTLLQYLDNDGNLQPGVA